MDTLKRSAFSYNKKIGWKAVLGFMFSMRVVK